MLTESACYSLLGLDARASLTEIRAAYRKLAQSLHPDKQGGDEERFKVITAAYNVLTGRSRAAKPAENQACRERAWADWQARTRRETQRRDQARRQAPPQAPKAEAAPQAEATHEGSVRGAFRRFRDRIHTWSARVITPADEGRDVTLRLSVDLDGLLHGARPRVAVRREVACPSCGGRDEECSVCNGARRVAVREEVRVSIPRGAKPGARLRLVGKGQEGLDGARSGDLFLELTPANVPGFRRDGADLYGVVDVDETLATKGGVLTVELPDSTVRVKVPAGSRTGRVVRLKARGLPRWREAGRGDIHLSLEVH